MANETDRPSGKQRVWLRLHDLYAANLSLYLPHLKADDAERDALRGRFLCPLCLAAYSREQACMGQLSVEHVLPSRAGGRLTTLTCRRCNNAAGTALERHLVNRLASEDPSCPQAMEATVGEGIIRGTIHRASDGAFVMAGVPSVCNPKSVALAEGALAAGAREIQLTIGLGYNEQRSRIALLKSAYLLMFQRYGYEYVLQPGTAVLREQISYPDILTPALQGVVWRHKPPIVDGTAVGIITNPPLSGAFLVFLALPPPAGAEARLSCVLLPGLAEASRAVYDRLRQERDAENGSVSYSFKLLPANPHPLSSQQSKCFLLAIWRSLALS